MAGMALRLPHLIICSTAGLMASREALENRTWAPECVTSPVNELTFRLAERERAA